MVAMPPPYRPMLLTPAGAPPEGGEWAHEAKLDGWRCLAQVVDGRVRLWSRTGRDWTAAVPELGALGALGPVVVDGELVLATSDGRADFDLLGQRMHDRRSAGPPVTLYVFDRIGETVSLSADQMALLHRAHTNGAR